MPYDPLDYKDEFEGAVKRKSELEEEIKQLNRFLHTVRSVVIRNGVFRKGYWLKLGFCPCCRKVHKRNPRTILCTHCDEQIKEAVNGS